MPEIPLERFIEDIQGRIEYFRHEYTFNYAEIIGSLELIKCSLVKDALEDN